MTRPRKIFLISAGLVLAAVLVLFFRIRDPEQQFEDGMAAAGRGDTRAAIRAANLLLQTDGFESRGHLLRGTLFLQANRHVAAVEEFRSAAEDPEMRAEAYTRCGETFYRMHQFVDAEQMLLQALDHNPEHSNARRWLASTYYDLGSMSLALEQLKIVARLNPDDGRPFRLSGRIEKDFHRFGEAVEAYRQALARTLPESERDAATAELAECLVELRQYSDALETLKQAQVSARVLALQSACHAALGDPDLAIRKADAALELQPNLIAAILTRASIELERGRAENVVELLQSTADAHPGNYEVLFQLVKALRLAGRNAEADAKSGRLAELDKLVDEFARLNSAAFGDLGNAQLRLQLGQLAQQLDRPELARAWLDAALAIDPSLDSARKLLKELNQPP